MSKPKGKFHMFDPKRAIGITFLLMLGISAPVWAQEDTAKESAPPATAKKKRPRTSLSAGEELVRRFDRSAPQLGDLVPDVSGFDADGKKFSLRSLKGSYAVLTFGCLT